jgi:Fe-S-cluster containining protein
MLKMSEDKKKRCPFVTEEGCEVYADRPANCRYYPVGQGTLKVEGKDGPQDEEFYFFINEPHCLGFEEDAEWSVGSWRADQEVDLYDSINKEWKGLQLRKNLPGQPPLDDKKQAQFYMACYDMDSFRSFVFESSFLETFDIDPETIQKIKDDEVELMKFGFKYIKYIMMLEQTLKIKESVLKERQEKK